MSRGVGLGQMRGKHALGGWLGQVWLAIQSLLVKRRGFGWDRWGNML